MRHLPSARGPHGRDAALVRALAAAVLAAILATALAGCGGGGSAGTTEATASPSPSVASYSDSDDDTIAFMTLKRGVIDEALVACDAFMEESGAALQEGDLAAFEAAQERWEERYEDLDEVVRDFRELPEGEHARVREATAAWSRYAVEVDGLYRAIDAVLDAYLERGPDTPAFDRAWAEFEEQRDAAYEALGTCDQIVYDIWELK